MTTIENIYTDINPLPAKLSEKGKVRPEVWFTVDANSKVSIGMNWKKPYAGNDWEKEYQYFHSESFQGALDKAVAFINELPTAEQARLNHFMGKLGKLIDAGKDDGIDCDYLNPLVDTMKRLAENAITYMPKHREMLHD